MGQTQITVVRHGETKWNKELRLQGHKDSPLTESGIRQAELLSETIKTKTFDIFISSDLGRAIQTSEIINKHLKLPVTFNKNLRERAFGVMESLFRDEAKVKHPDVYEAFMTRDPDFDVQGGESLVVFYNRIIQELSAIAEANTGKKVLIVAHGGVLDCIIRKIVTIPLQEPRTFTIRNSSVNTFSVSNGAWMLEEWGNIEHLQNTAALNEIN